jgi:F0F1-type ATP synthase assembly protein I
MMDGEDSSSSEARARIQPIRRTYKTEATSGIRDVDSFERAVRIRVFLWSFVGAFLGLLLGFFAMAGGRGPWVLLVCVLAGWGSAYFGPLFIAHMAGRAGGALYAPSGKSTPRKKEHSLAESLVVRGMYEEAFAVFQDAINDDPTDWQPYVRIARIKRDQTSDVEGAAVWFKRAISESGVPSGPRLLMLKEYVELCSGRLETPGKAMPLLARIAEVESDTPEGAWAATALAEIKRTMSWSDDPE